MSWKNTGIDFVDCTLYVEGEGYFSEMQIQDRAGAYGEEKRRIFCTAKEG